MKIYNKIVYDFNNNIIEEDYYEYNGPLTLANAAGAASTGGSPKQMSKDKVKKDKEEKEMTEEFNEIDKDIEKDKTTTPKDIERDNEKVKVPKKTTPKVAPKPTVPKIVAPKPTVPKKPDPREDNRGGTQVKPTIKKTILTKEPPKVERGDNDGGNNTTTTPKVKVPVIPKVNTAPTTVEVDQSSATDTTIVKEDDIYTRKKKAKARGRSMMTLTGPQGVKKDDKLTLGRPSLLGS